MHKKDAALKEVALELKDLEDIKSKYEQLKVENKKVVFIYVLRRHACICATCTHTHMHTHTCLHVCMHACMCACVCICVCMSVCV